MDILKQLSLAGLVPVIKLKNAQDAVPLCDALARGGLPVAEITFRTDAAEQSIRNVSAALPAVLLGAGTVLTCEQVDRALDAGAGYIVSPGLNPVVVEHCVKRGVPVVPGCANPSDIERALSLGLKTVKFFPAESLGGLAMIKAMSAPYGDVRFMPTGGISPKNLCEYLSNPKIVACGGSWIAPEDAIAGKDWARVETLAREAVALMLGFEILHVGVNTSSAQDALSCADTLTRMLGWASREGNSSVMSGTGIEFMKKPGRGQMGHIAIGTHNVARARWHLEKRGFEFDDASAAYAPDGRLKAVYTTREIGGFALHLLQK